MARLRLKFPAAFSEPKPLCVGIYEACVCGLWPGNCGLQNHRYFAYGAALAVVLDRWTKAPAYLRQCVEGAARYDLAGEICGYVTEWEAAFAAAELARVTVATATDNFLA
jgi:sRNA-binding protein